MRHPGLTDGPIYLDYNATTPVDPHVVEAALPYLTRHFGNPSSSHAYATQPRTAVAEARRQVARLLRASDTEIVFTGGGSEADTLAIRGAALAARAQRRGDHVVTQVTEHPAVLEACRSLTADGFTCAIAHSHGALLHTDSAQAVGKIQLDVTELGVDLLTVVGHKMYAPKGIGALYVRSGTPIQPIVHGAGQERGLRAGTENVAFIVALGVAAELAAARLPSPTVRDVLHEELDRLLPGGIQLNGHPVDRLPNTLNISLAGINGKELLAATPKIAASTGSACHEGVDSPSAVLTAMGLSSDRALAAVRLSCGRWTTTEQARRAADLLAAGYKAMRHD